MVVRPAPVVTVPHTVIFAHGPTTLAIELWDSRTLFLCKEVDSGNPQLGTALSCTVYDLSIPGEAQRFYVDLYASVITALRG